MMENEAMTTEAAVETNPEPRLSKAELQHLKKTEKEIRKSMPQDKGSVCCRQDVLRMFIMVRMRDLAFGKHGLRHHPAAQASAWAFYTTPPKGFDRVAGSSVPIADTQGLGSCLSIGEVDATETEGSFHSYGGRVSFRTKVRDGDDTLPVLVYAAQYGRDFLGWVGTTPDGRTVAYGERGALIGVSDLAFERKAVGIVAEKADLDTWLRANGILRLS